MIRAFARGTIGSSSPPMTNVGLFDREVHATDDSELVFATFNSRAQLGGRPYVNRYICRARVRDGLATATSGRESVVLSGMRHDYKQENLSPLTNFIGLLWNKLALNDFSLKPIADGLRVTETTDTTGSFGMRSYKFADITTPQIAAQWRNHGPFYY
jgi:hypothetical protein